MVDRAAAGAAFELVRRTELLLDRWGTHPPAALKAGGLGVRELRAAATLLHVEPEVAALVIETASAAGLLDQGMTDDLDAAWLPTEALRRLAGRLDRRSAGPPWRGPGWPARGWCRPSAAASATSPSTRSAPSSPAAGWSACATTCWPSWSTSTSTVPSRRAPVSPRWWPGCAGGDRDDCLPGSTRSVPCWRRRPRSASPGWTRCRRSDGCSSPARSPPRRCPALLPAPVDHILLQADLTAIAPGPLEQELARKLALVADVESRGGATVYRFAASSVRRAFDAGWSAAEMHDFVSATSRTPVPQSLDYLVDDVSRRFGTLRAGHAESFLRSDDETALTELMHAPGAESLRLRRIAPTVVVSDVPLGTLLPRIRELGLAPVVEAVDGTVRVARPDVFRARTSPRRRPRRGWVRAPPLAPPPWSPRSGSVTGPRPPARPRVSAATPSDVIAMLRQAAEAREQLVIGYVGNDGTVAERMVSPVRVEGGQLTAYDERSDSHRTFALHRITAVSRPVDPDAKGLTAAVA